MVGVFIVCALAGTLLVLVNEIGKHLPADSAPRRLLGWLRLQARGRVVHPPTWCTPGRVDATCDPSADYGFRGDVGTTRSPRPTAVEERTAPVAIGAIETSWSNLDVPDPAPSYP